MNAVPHTLPSGRAEPAAVVGTDAANVMAWRRYLGPAGLTIMPPGAVHPTRLVLR